MVFGFVIILTLQINPRNGGRMQKSIIIGTHTFHDTFSHLSVIELCFFLPYSYNQQNKGGSYHAAKQRSILLHLSQRRLPPSRGLQGMRTVSSRWDEEPAVLLPCNGRTEKRGRGLTRWTVPGWIDTKRKICRRIAWYYAALLLISEGVRPFFRLTRSKL